MKRPTKQQYQSPTSATSSHGDFSGVKNPHTTTTEEDIKKERFYASRGQGKRQTRRRFEDHEEEMNWIIRCCWEVLVIAGPIALSVSVANLVMIYSLYYAGHTLDRFSYAGFAMGISFSNITASALGLGLSCALDTLCSQEFGRNSQSKKIGLYLQRSVVATVALFIPLQIVYQYSEPVLKNIIQPEIAVPCAWWLRWSVWISLPTVLASCLQKYIQCHGETTPVMWSSIIGTVTIPMIMHSLVKYKLAGFLAGLAINRIITLGVMIGLTARNPLFSETWPGWTKRCLDLKAMKAYLLVGLPNMVAFCADLWGFEAMAVMAGRLGSLEVAVWTIILNVLFLCWGPCVGICSASAVKVGAALGANDPVEAKKMVTASILLSLLLGAALGLTSWHFGRELAQFLQPNKEVVDRAVDVLGLNGVSLFIDMTYYVMQGIFRGCGEQNLGAMLVAVAHWCIGVPISAYLAFWQKLSVEGILLGFIGGMVVIVPVFFFYLFRKFNWAEMALRISNEESKPNLGNPPSYDGRSPDEEDEAALAQLEGRPATHRTNRSSSNDSPDQYGTFTV